MTKNKGKYRIPEEEHEGKILPNKLSITDLDKLHEAEAEGFSNAELDLIEELTDKTQFDVAYIRDIHRRALFHLYEFAGEYRSVNMSKAGFMFAAAHVIPNAMKIFERDMLLGLPHVYRERSELVRDIGKVHAELLFIHPFREGNGRTMRVLANLMAYKSGYGDINFDPVNKDGKMRERYFKAVQAAGAEDYKSMIDLIDELLSSG